MGARPSGEGFQIPGYDRVRDYLDAVLRDAEQTLQLAAHFAGDPYQTGCGAVEAANQTQDEPVAGERALGEILGGQAVNAEDQLHWHPGQAMSAEGDQVGVIHRREQGAGTTLAQVASQREKAGEGMPGSQIDAELCSTRT